MRDDAAPSPRLRPVALAGRSVCADDRGLDGVVAADADGRVQGQGRQLLPPMPWPAYKNMTDDDLKAIFAYLQTITAIKNKVPDPVMAPPPPAK